jgi:dipeptidyl aminopeptidase/acylaminoacyl peptidase
MDGTFRVLDVGPEQAPPARFTSEGFIVPAADAGDADVHGVLYLPPDFEPDRSYPVIDCIYGGPQTIAHRTGADHLWGSFTTVAEALSQLGFVTVVLDSRGTPGRGRAFQWPDGQRGSDVVVDDHRAALHRLAAERPWMDLGRCGVLGTSFGAYYAARCGLLAPELFRAVVAHAGPYDLTRVLPGWFPGLLAATYDEDRDAYRDAGLIAHAKDFRPELLLIHGTDDANVTMDHTMRLSHALTRAGQQHDLLLLAGQRHHLDVGAATFALEVAGRFLRRHLIGSG